MSTPTDPADPADPADPGRPDASHSGANTGAHAIRTRLAHLARDRALTGGFVNPAVFRGSTYLFEDMADLRRANAAGHPAITYGRRGTQTTQMLAELLSDLEGGAGTQLVANGVAAALVAIGGFVMPGDSLLAPDNVYTGTRSLLRHWFRPRGVETRFYDPRDPASAAALVDGTTRLMILEAPGSETFEIPDLEALVAIARSHGLVTMLDNTWATPLCLQPLALGIDMSMHSLTKYIIGHSDAFGGAVICNARTIQRVRETASVLGQGAAPDECWLALRGLRSLAARLDHHQAAALTVARWLEQQPEVAAVLHPALESFPDHGHWRRWFSGSTGLFAIVLEGHDQTATDAFVDGLALFGIGYSWGAFESLALPQTPTRVASANPLLAHGDLVRLHIGLEDPADLIADLAAGLTRRRRLRLGGA